MNKKTLSTILAAAHLAFAMPAQAEPAADALPEGYRAGVGATQYLKEANVGTFVSSDAATTGYWDSFQVGREAAFNADIAGVHLSKVTGGDPSEIFGAMNVRNGQFFLVNTGGIVFGPDAQVNAPGLVASTLDMAESDFLAGHYAFNASEASGLVLNQGGLRSTGGGFVALVGRAVRNEGSIDAPLGSVALASGESVTLSVDNAGLVAVEVNGPIASDVYDLAGNRISDAIANPGAISAAGGHVILSAQAAEEVFDSAINHSGIVSATSVENRNGVIEFRGGNVGLFEEARVDASGDEGGGTILMNASRLYFGPDTSVLADARVSGDGGRVVGLAEKSAYFYGDISVRGGLTSGNGGFVETSGKEFIQITDTPDIRAFNGSAGGWLIDPNNLNLVASGGNTNINTTNPFVTTNDTASLGVDLIVAALTGGATVTVSTGTGGTNSQVGDITLSSAIDFNGGTGTNTLVLNAHDNLTISASITDSSPGDGDKLNVVLNADSDSSLSTGGPGIMSIDAIIATQGGNFTATTPSGDIVLGNVDNLIDLRCSACANGNAVINASVGSIAVTDTGANTEIRTSGNVNLDARIIGTLATPLSLEDVTALTIHDRDTVSANMWLEELTANSITSVTLTVASVTSGDIDVNFFNSDVIDINNAHTFTNVNLDGFNRAFDYTAVAGDIAFAANGLRLDTSSTTDTIEAQAGNIVVVNNSILMVSGFLELIASGNINGSANDNTPEIELTGGISLKGDGIGNTNQLEILSNNQGGGNETLEIESTAAAGQATNIQVLNQGFNEISIIQDDSDSSIDIDLPDGTDVIDINGSAGGVTLNNITLTHNPDTTVFDYENTDSANGLLTVVTLDTLNDVFLTTDSDIRISGAITTTADVFLTTAGNGSDILDLNSTALDITADIIVFDTTGAGGDVATSADPMEVYASTVYSGSVSGSAHFVNSKPSNDSGTTTEEEATNEVSNALQTVEMGSPDGSEQAVEEQTEGDSEEGDEEDGDEEGAEGGDTGTQDEGDSLVEDKSAASEDVAVSDQIISPCPA